MINVKWPSLVISQHVIIQWINLGNGTLHRIILFKPKMRSRLFVGIERRGCFLFPLGFLSGDYVSEKLNMCLADANNLADFLNAQICVGEFDQQGNYTERYILENECVYHFGEHIEIPLVPEIVDGHGRDRANDKGLS